MKIKNLFASLILITHVLSCTSNENDKEVFLFNTLSFKLIQGENLVDINPEIKQNYHSYFKNTPLQIPLFKCIKTSEYTIYLGIPYNTSIEELLKLPPAGQTSDPTRLQSDSSSYFFKTQTKNTTHLSEYARVFDKNLIYIVAITNSKIISDSLFNHSELSNRFNYK
jgi:hypothetical protein